MNIHSYVHIIMNNIIEEIEQLNADTIFTDLSEFFKVFGDKTRLTIIYTLSKGEMKVSDIAEILNMEQSAISHQLRLLKTSRLAKTRREGKSIFYSLDDDHVHLIFNQGLDHIKHRGNHGT